MAEKNKLELEKLQVEIQNLKKPWWKKAEYLNLFMTGIIAAFTLIYALASGILDIKSERLQLEKKMLENDIFLFRLKRDTLIEENAKLKKQIYVTKDSLVSVLFQLQKSNDTLVQKLNYLESEKIRLSSIEKIYKSD